MNADDQIEQYDSPGARAVGLCHGMTQEMLESLGSQPEVCASVSLEGADQIQRCLLSWGTPMLPVKTQRLPTTHFMLRRDV